MIYKRATKQLRNAGIEHIVINKCLWGAVPHDPRLSAQNSKVFKSPKEAIDAVIDGYRPSPYVPVD